MLKSRQKIYSFSIPLEIVLFQSVLVNGSNVAPNRLVIKSVNIFNRVTNPATSLGFITSCPSPEEAKAHMTLTVFDAPILKASSLPAAFKKETLILKTLIVLTAWDADDTGCENQSRY